MPRVEEVVQFYKDAAESSVQRDFLLSADSCSPDFYVDDTGEMRRPPLGGYGRC